MCVFRVRAWDYERRRYLARGTYPITTKGYDDAYTAMGENMSLTLECVGHHPVTVMYCADDSQLVDYGEDICQVRFVDFGPSRMDQLAGQKR
jgi:hypothetical protein